MNFGEILIYLNPLLILSAIYFGYQNLSKTDKKYDYLVDGKYIYNNDIDIDNLINLYDYLIKIPLYDLSEEKIDELEKDIHNNKLKLEELMDLSIEDIWGNELDLLKKKI